MALEERLKNLSQKQGIDLQRLRRQETFNRFLSRLSSDWILKGGYALELRLKGARATKDIDLALKATSISSKDEQTLIIRQMLMDAAQKDMGDYFGFLIGLPTMDLEAQPYGGSRFPVEAHLDGRLFARYPMDIVVASMILEPERIVVQDSLAFADAGEFTMLTISKEQQFAEKLHAFTSSRKESENSRVKDLVDLLLLTKGGELKPNLLRTAIQKIFEYRNTHFVPVGLLEPPQSWINVFMKLSKETGLNMNMDQTTAHIAAHLNIPVFAREEKAVSTPKQTRCHFCDSKASGWLSKLRSGAINESEEAWDYDCPRCRSYRVTELFKEVNNGITNRNNWENWKHYLQNRTPENKKQRVFISTYAAFPPK